MSNIQGSILQTMSVISKITAAKNLAKKEQTTDTKTTETETQKTEVADNSQFKNFLASENMRNALQQRRQEILNQQPIIDTMKGEDDK